MRASVLFEQKTAKLDHATALGATHAVDAAREDPVARIKAITRRGADFTLVAVGDARAMSQACEALAPGGVCVLIGVPATGATGRGPAPARHRGARDPGLSYGGARTREDSPRLVDLYRGSVQARRADHAPLRPRRGQRGVSRPRGRRASPRPHPLLALLGDGLGQGLHASLRLRRRGARLIGRTRRIQGIRNSRPMKSTTSRM